MKFRFLLLSLFFLCSFSTFAQSSGDYRSLNSGTWESAGNWQRFTTAWGTAPSAPTSADGVITIQSSHSLTINGSRSIDETIINSGGTVQVNSGILTIDDGTGTDLDILGTMLWVNGALLTVNIGALVTGPSANVFYRGATMINNGIINVNLFGMQPDPGAQTISGVGSFSNLTIGNSNGVTLGGDQTITTLLNFNSGLLITGPNKVIITTTGSIQDNSGGQNLFVNGNLQMNYNTGLSTKTFRIGDASGLRSVDATLNASVGGGMVISTSTGENPNIGTSSLQPSKSVNRSWKMTNVGLLFSNSFITFRWTAGEVDGGANTANFVAGRFASSLWSYPSILSQTSTSIQTQGIATFATSSFAVAENCTPTGQ